MPPPLPGCLWPYTIALAGLPVLRFPQPAPPSNVQYLYPTKAKQHPPNNQTACHFNLTLLVPVCIPATTHCLTAGNVHARTTKVMEEPEARSFFQEYSGEAWFEGLCTSMAERGETTALCVSRMKGVASWQSLAGPTDPKEVRYCCTLGDERFLLVFFFHIYQYCTA